MLKEAGEVKLTGSFKIQNQVNSPRGISLSPSVDVAAAPVDHFGIFASFRHTNRYTDDDDWYTGSSQDSVHYSGNRGEFGAGYFTQFGGKGLFGLYAGGGFGQLSRNNLKSLGGNYDAKYYRIFLQPEVGFNHRDRVAIGGGIRFTYQRYNSFKSSDSALRYAFTEPAADIEDIYFYLFEPYINMSFGYKYVQFNLQPGLSLDISSPNFSNVNPFYMSIGVTFQFAPRFAKGESNRKERMEE